MIQAGGAAWAKAIALVQGVAVPGASFCGGPKGWAVNLVWRVVGSHRGFEQGWVWSGLALESSLPGWGPRVGVMEQATGLRTGPAEAGA